MQQHARHPNARVFLVLHLVFALTGILHVIGGPLLPSLASTYRLNDSQSGLLFFVYFAGSALGAMLCVRHYVRLMTIGFLAAVLCCLAAASIRWPFLLSAFLLLGISVGVPMSAISLFVGREFPRRSAPILLFLNFSWSAGALLAPLLAARLLMHHSFRVAYVLLAGAAAVAAVACATFLRDSSEPTCLRNGSESHARIRVIAAFAVAAFLQVGVENTALAWIPTYMLRATGKGPAFAAAISSLYWVGFLSSRAFSSFALLRVRSIRILQVALPLALLAAILLCGSSSASIAGVAMLCLGIVLAPIYPLIVATSFVHLRQTADTRWILAAAGFGGSTLPWLTGWVSSQSGSIRAGILTLPAALLLMILLFLVGVRPIVSGKRQQA